MRGLDACSSKTLRADLKSQAATPIARFKASSDIGSYDEATEPF